MAWDDDKFNFNALFEREIFVFLDAIAAAMDEDQPHIPGLTESQTQAPSRPSAIRHLRRCVLEGTLPRLVREVEACDPQELAKYWRKLQSWHRVTLTSYQRQRPLPPVRPWSGEPCADVRQIPSSPAGPGRQLAEEATATSTPAPTPRKRAPAQEGRKRAKKPASTPAPTPRKRAPDREARKRAKKPTSRPGRRPLARVGHEGPSDEQVLAAYEQHQNKAAAARALGIPRSTLADRLDRLGVNTWDGRRTLDPAKDPSDEQIVAAVERLGITAAARELGMHRSTLSDRLRRLGYEPQRRVVTENVPTDAEVLAAIDRHPTKADAARALGIPRTTLNDRLRRLRGED